MERTECLHIFWSTQAACSTCGVFFQGVELSGRTMGCSRKGGPCSCPLFKLILFRLPGPVARILFPSEKNKLCTWKHILKKKKTLRISNSLSVPLLHPREMGSPWSVGSKCIDSLCQVVRILQDVSASSPTVLFSQDRTPKSIAQSPLPPCPLVVIIVSMSRLFDDVMVRRCIVVCHAYTHLNQQWDESMAHLVQTPRARRMLLMGKGSSCWKCAFCSS